MIYWIGGIKYISTLTWIVKGIRMSADLIVRLIGMVVFAIIGTYYGLNSGKLPLLLGDNKSFHPRIFVLDRAGGRAFWTYYDPFFTTQPVRAAKNG